MSSTCIVVIVVMLYMYCIQLCSSCSVPSVIYNISSLFSNHSWVYFNHAVHKFIGSSCIFIYRDCNCVPNSLYMYIYIPFVNS